MSDVKLTGKELEFAKVLAFAEDNGAGIIPDSPQAVALLGVWVDHGLAASHVDGDGDQVFVLTTAGRAALAKTQS